MNSLSIPTIQISKPESDFSIHLLSNERILFSGAFGIGKTFFLKHYFNIPEIKEKYNVFHLFPTNYQIATNEDIFELIKYDILINLLGFDWVKVDDSKFSDSLAYRSYFMNNSVDIMAKVFQCAPMLEKVGKAIETLSNIYKDALKFKENINKNEIDLVETFFREFDFKKGSIYEFDAVSNFIYSNLASCNNDIKGVSQKENILIIDDLDRIDPEHIFRLLNVFSAHFDRDDGKNKFGFNKIVFVCDVENIRNIFAAKYGQNTDFSGYIDKYYSSQVFYFNNRTVINTFVNKILRETDLHSQHEQNRLGVIELSCLGDVLNFFVEGKAITVRKLIANIESLRNINIESYVIGNRYYIGNAIIKICLQFFGGQKYALLDAFNKMTLPFGYNKKLNEIASFILPILINDINTYFSDDVATTQTYPTNKGFMINFELLKEWHLAKAEITSPTLINIDVLKDLFLEAINKLDEKGLLY